MKITPSSTPKKPTYPTLLAIAAAGAMMTPACTQNEREKTPVPEDAKASQQAQLTFGVVKAPREPQRLMGKVWVREPQGRAGDIRRLYPKDKNTTKPATPPEKK